jgi:hypothetical protein
MNKTEYYVKIEGNEHGPFTVLEIKQLIKDQIIFNNSLVRDSNSSKYVNLDSIFKDNVANKRFPVIYKNSTYIIAGIILSILLLMSYIEYKFEITNAKLKDFAAKNNADELLSFQNAMNEIDKNIQTSKASQVDILRRFEKLESSALQMATDYKLIKSTKDSIESLNNTVLQLKNSSELNNKMQIDGFKNQVSQLQASYETLLKNSSQISNENQKIVKDFQVLQKNWSVIASLEKNMQDINKKIIGIEEFNQLVLKDLNAHQSKLNTYEDWFKGINRR